VMAHGFSAVKEMYLDKFAEVCHPLSVTPSCVLNSTSLLMASSRRIIHRFSNYNSVALPTYRATSWPGANRARKIDACIAVSGLRLRRPG
jgi:hypothetical protein